MEELHDWFCWSRWYATSNNPHQEDRLPLFTRLPRRHISGNSVSENGVNRKHSFRESPLSEASIITTTPLGAWYWESLQKVPRTLCKHQRRAARSGLPRSPYRGSR